MNNSQQFIEIARDQFHLAEQEMCRYGTHRAMPHLLAGLTALTEGLLVYLTEDREQVRQSKHDPNNTICPLFGYHPSVAERGGVICLCVSKELEI